MMRAGMRNRALFSGAEKTAQPKMDATLNAAKNA
jgi:hypothetical protein